jgi:hypothetical protein
MLVMKKIPEERQIALILKDYDQGQLRELKKLIIAAIVLMNKKGNISMSDTKFKNDLMMN